MSTGARRLRPEVAARRIASFRARFGEEHLFLAWHAAFPLTLTPDLLYQIWAGFQRDVEGRLLRVPWVAVADLLLSGLCNEVGHDIEEMHLFEMDLGVRAALLGALEADPRFGPRRLRDLSAFLLEYIQHQAYAHTPEPSDLTTSQRWTALAYVQPGEAARELAEAFARAGLEDRPELVRIASVVEALEPALPAFTPLVEYAKGMAAFARKDLAGAAAALGDIIERADVHVAGVKLLVPRSVLNMVASSSTPGAGHQEHVGDPTSPVLGMQHTVQSLSVDHDQIFVGRGRELEDIANAFAHGQAVHLVGEPGMGKTALLTRIARRPPSGFRAVSVHTASIFSPDDLMRGMARSIADTSFDVSTASLSELRDIIDRLPPTLFIAKDLALLGRGHAASFSKEYMEMMRHLLEERKLLWASSARHELAEILDGADELTSSFQASVKTIHVGQLDQESARALASLVAGQNADIVLAEAGGFPRGLRLLGGLIREMSLDDAVASFRKEMAGIFDSWWRGCKVQERELLHLCTQEAVFIGAVDDNGEHALQRLVDRGLIVERDGIVQLEGSAWRDFVREVKESDREALAAERTAHFTFYDEVALRDRLVASGHCPKGQTVEMLNIFSTPKQHTWLVITPQSMMCVLDDADTRRKDTLVQFVARSTEILPVSAALKPGSRSTGVLRLGKKQWLYSAKLFRDPETLVARINGLMKRTGLGLMKRTGLGPPVASPPAAATVAPAWSARVERVDIGILTTREDELAAVLQRFPDKLRTVSGHRRYLLRRLRLSPAEAYTVAVVRCAEQGNDEAQAAATDLLEDLAPSWILIVGIASGVPANEFSLGDVIVSTRIIDFDVEAVLKGSFREYAFTGAPMHPDVAMLVADLRAMVEDGPLEGWNDESAIGRPLPLVEVADEDFHGDDAWKKDVRSRIERRFITGKPRPPLVTTGAIASSDRLIKSADVLQEWLEIARQVQAVEMETAGIYRVARRRQVPVLTIRGISDVIGFKRRPDWTEYACHSAAAFMLALLRARPIEPQRDEEANGVR